MPRLFGTDGIRGIANVDLRPTTAYALGRAVAHRLAGPGGAIVVGQDTRRSGDMFVAAIVAGATSLGVDVHLVGVRPDAGARLPRGLRPVRRRDHGLRLAQPGPGQRAQGARRARAQARRRGRGRARAADLADRGAGRRPQRRPRPDGRRVDACWPTTSSTGSVSRRPSTPAGSGSSSTARTARPRWSGRRSWPRPGAQVDVIHAEPGRQQHQRPIAARRRPHRSRPGSPRPARTWASRSTAMRTG